MGNILRRLGVYGDNLPTKKNLTVAPSDFSIGGLIAKFERAYDKSFVCNDIDELRTIFGSQVFSGQYGWDAAQGFFTNLAGISGKLIVKAHVGYTGSAIDAVSAFANLLDTAGSPQNTLKLTAGFQQTPEYGASGNRTGYQIVNGFRFGTAFDGAALPAATSAVLDSVAGIKVGDVMKFVLTSGGTATVYKKILTVTESTRTVTWSGVLHATVGAADGDVANVLGFQLKTFRKDTTGIVNEVETQLGQVWCTMEPEVADFYAPNVHSTNKWLVVEDLAVVEASPEMTFPATVATTSYLTSGADGTSPSTAAHWSRDIAKMATDPIRFIANPETTDETIQKSLETAMQARSDKPKVIFNVASNQTKTQLIDIGHRFQRSDDVLGVICGHWLQVTDPFTVSPVAPPREIPNVGHIMGAWVRVIGAKGIHYVPAVKDNPLLGITGVVGDQFLDDNDRTDLAEAGVNCIQFVSGYGFVIRNFFTPSTKIEFRFANGILMREYIKVSAVDSLQSSENTPNSFARIKEDKMAIQSFMYRLWAVGSTGNVPTGETLGQIITADGGATTAEEHFEVKADAVNNPSSSVVAGERNLDVWFSYPAPAGSIKIGVGILLKN